MKVSDFDYSLPEELIAQEPLAERDSSRLLVLHRSTGQIEHKQFKDFPSLVNSQDVLVFNQSKVIKARLIGQRPSGGKVELFILKTLPLGQVEALVHATARQKEGMSFSVGERLTGKILGQCKDSIAYLVQLSADGEELQQILEELGHVPLPPYIRREDTQKDQTRYQTVYAKHLGSVAAPTAGLHFTPKILEQIALTGADLQYVTLHVGLGTFQPIKVENLAEHKMHRESFDVPFMLKEKCAKAKLEKKRVVAIGTTSVRALESAARGLQGETELFLHPGEKFHWVDALFTNFHQPKSSLLVMLSAFVGNKELLMHAYQEAIRERYRFFSYGDCMLVL